MRRFVLLQLFTTLITALIAGMISGRAAFFSALLGGLCCVVPNVLFALQLFARHYRKNGQATVLSFFTGELLKITLTVILLFLTMRFYSDLNWIAMIVGMIIALKNYIFLLFFKPT